MPVGTRHAMSLSCWNGVGLPLPARPLPWECASSTGSDDRPGAVRPRSRTLRSARRPTSSWRIRAMPARSLASACARAAQLWRQRRRRAASSPTGRASTSGRARTPTRRSSSTCCRTTCQAPRPWRAWRCSANVSARAFAAGGGDYRAPAQLLGDFLAGRPSTGPGAVRPTYPLGVTWTALDALLPGCVTEGCGPVFRSWSASSRALRCPMRCSPAWRPAQARP